MQRIAGSDMSLRKKKKQGHANSERWLLTYSDLITLLMAFFVVMYSMAQMDLSKFQQMSASMQKAFNVMVLEGMDNDAVHGEGANLESPSPDDIDPLKTDAGPESIQTQDFAAIQKDMSQFAKMRGVEGKVNVRSTQEGIVISLSGNLLFDPAKAELKPQAVVILDKVAEVIKTRKNEVRVEGHTDNVPVESALYPSNWELSTARSISVVKYFTTISGILPDRMSAVGFGEYRPLVDNDTREHRAQNRRADIVILYG